MNTEPYSSDNAQPINHAACPRCGRQYAERVIQLESAAENDVFIIKRQTERIKELEAELQVARKQSLARLCALGRELDGPKFDESPFHSMGLSEIATRLRDFEVRFHKKYSILNNEEDRNG